MTNSRTDSAPHTMWAVQKSTTASTLQQFPGEPDSASSLQFSSLTLVKWHSFSWPYVLPVNQMTVPKHRRELHMDTGQPYNSNLKCSD